MDKVCLQCGHVGFTNAFVFCVKCRDVAMHRYCMDVIPDRFDEHVYWVCEDCEVVGENPTLSYNGFNSSEEKKKDTPTKSHSDESRHIGDAHNLIKNEELELKNVCEIGPRIEHKGNRESEVRECRTSPILEPAVAPIRSENLGIDCDQERVEVSTQSPLSPIDPPTRELKGSTDDLRISSTKDNGAFSPSTSKRKMNCNRGAVPPQLCPLTGKTYAITSEDCKRFVNPEPGRFIGQQIEDHFPYPMTQWKQSSIFPEWRTMVDRWFSKFTDKFTHLPGESDKFRATWESHSQERFRDKMFDVKSKAFKKAKSNKFDDIRKNEVKPHWISLPVWNDMVNFWADPNYLKICVIASQNRNTFCGKNDKYVESIKKARENGTCSHPTNGDKVWLEVSQKGPKRNRIYGKPGTYNGDAHNLIKNEGIEIENVHEIGPRIEHKGNRESEVREERTSPILEPAVTPISDNPGRGCDQGRMEDVTISSLSPIDLPTRDLGGSTDHIKNSSTNDNGAFSPSTSKREMNCNRGAVSPQLCPLTGKTYAITSEDCKRFINPEPGRFIGKQIEDHFPYPMTQWRQSSIFPEWRTMVDKWYSKFTDKFTHLPGESDKFRATWESNSQERFRDKMFEVKSKAFKKAKSNKFDDICKNEVKPHWISLPVWKDMVNFWADPNYLNICVIASQNRNMLFGENASKHTGGSISNQAHDERMDKYVESIKEARENGTSSHPTSCDKVWLEVSQKGPKRNRIYGKPGAYNGDAHNSILNEELELENIHEIGPRIEHKGNRESEVRVERTSPILEPAVTPIRSDNPGPIDPPTRELGSSTDDIRISNTKDNGAFSPSTSKQKMNCNRGSVPSLLCPLTGKTYAIPSEDCKKFINPEPGRFIAKQIEEHFPYPMVQWKQLSIFPEWRTMVDRWFSKFSAKFTYRPGEGDKFRAAWDSHSQDRYRDKMFYIRKSNTKPHWICLPVWNDMVKFWADPNYQKICANASQNRNTFCGETVSKDAGVSISNKAQPERMESQSGIKPSWFEVYKENHKTKREEAETREGFIDNRSKSVHDKYVESIEEARENGTSSQPTNGVESEVREEKTSPILEPAVTPIRSDNPGPIDPPTHELGSSTDDIRISSTKYNDASSSSTLKRKMNCNRGLCPVTGKTYAIPSEDGKKFINPAPGHFIAKQIEEHFPYPMTQWRQLSIFPEWRTMIDRWFSKFADKFTHHPGEGDKFRAAWESHSQDRYREKMFHIRKSEIKPHWISLPVWNDMVKFWTDSNYQKICTNAFQNRNTFCGETVSNHVGGSISHQAQPERMESQSGKNPSRFEVYKETHDRKRKEAEKGEGFIDDSSNCVHDKHSKSIKEANENGTCSHPTNDDKVLFEASENGSKRNRVYVNPGAYTNTPHMPASSSQVYTQREVDEMLARNKEQLKEEIRQEFSKLAEKFGLSSTPLPSK